MSDMDMKTLSEDWPYRQLNELADALGQEIRDGVRRVMRDFGEDPGNTALFELRCRQVGWSLRDVGRPR